MEVAKKISHIFLTIVFCVIYVYFLANIWITKKICEVNKKMNTRVRNQSLFSFPCKAAATNGIAAAATNAACVRG